MSGDSDGEGSGRPESEKGSGDWGSWGVTCEEAGTYPPTDA